MTTKINYQYYPQTARPIKPLVDVVRCFERHHNVITKNKQNDASSVLKALSADLKKLGFHTGEKGKKVAVPVLFGKNGLVEKQFLIDAFHAKEGIVLEVEAAAAVINYLYLKDLFEASLMEDANYLLIAVRNSNPTTNGQNDFETVCRTLDAIYASGRLVLPLKGILIIGY